MLDTEVQLFINNWCSQRNYFVIYPKTNSNNDLFFEVKKMSLANVRPFPANFYM